MAIFAYGSCMGRYEHPISERRLNPTYEFLNCCFFYFALSIAVPFSGGHLNPAVSISLHFFRKNKKLAKMVGAQLIGAFLGVTVGTSAVIQPTCSSEWCPTTIGRV